MAAVSGAKSIKRFWTARGHITVIKGHQKNRFWVECDQCLETRKTPVIQRDLLLYFLTFYEDHIFPFLLFSLNILCFMS
jgi:hypothetical protein